MIIEAGLYKRCGAENTALPNLLRFGFRSTPLSFTAFLKAIYRLKSPDVSRSLAFADRIPVSKIKGSKQKLKYILVRLGLLR